MNSNSFVICLQIVSVFFLGCFVFASNDTKLSNMPNSDFTGIHRTFYPSGKIRTVDEYVSGEINGRTIVFYENGVVEYVGYLSKGLREGLHRTYYESGILSKAIIYKNGKEYGVMLRYDEEGLLDLVMMLNESDAHVPQIIYSKDDNYDDTEKYKKEIGEILNEIKKEERRK